MSTRQFQVFSTGNEREREEWEWNLRKRLARALNHRWRKLLPRLVLADPCNGLPTPRNLTAELDGDRIKLTFKTLPGNPNDYGDPPDVSFEQSVGGGPWQYVFVYGAGTPSGYHELYDWFWSPFDAAGDPVTDRVCYRSYHFAGSSRTGTKSCYSNTACVDLVSPTLPVPLNVTLTYVHVDWSTYTYRVRLDWEADQTGVEKFEILMAYYSNNGYGVPPGIDPSSHLAMVDVPAGAAGVAAFQFEHDVPLNSGRAFAVRAVSPSGAIGAKSNTVGMEVFEGF